VQRPAVIQVSEPVLKATDILCGLTVSGQVAIDCGNPSAALVVQIDELDGLTPEGDFQVVIDHLNADILRKLAFEVSVIKRTAQAIFVYTASNLMPIEVILFITLGSCGCIEGDNADEQYKAYQQTCNFCYFFHKYNLLFFLQRTFPDMDYVDIVA
jgi:hypothetical protein